jgi:transcriptional regulator with XRE-family HTH domain
MRHEDAGAIGGRIARARKESGLTQEELASRVGVTARSIQGYEAGKVVPYRHLNRLAEITDRELAWFLESDDASALAQVAARLVTLVEEVAEEARAIREVAERLERLLAAGPPASPDESPRARGSGARR